MANSHTQNEYVSAKSLEDSLMATPQRIQQYVADAMESLRTTVLRNPSTPAPIYSRLRQTVYDLQEYSSAVITGVVLDARAINKPQLSQRRD